MGTKHQKFEIEIPEDYSADAREAIADDLLELIRDRTANGLDWKGNPLRKYSKEYVESVNFEIAGKSKNEVNFTQTGDTLAAMKLLESEPGRIVIGWEKGSTANAIADGNIRGTYGRDKPDPSKARPILGVTKKELREVLADYPVSKPDKLQASIDRYLAARDEADDE